MPTNNVRVPTGEATDYIFKVGAASGFVEIQTVGRGTDDRFADHYCDLEGKGKTAVRRLMESHERYAAIVDEALKLANFDGHGRFIGFVELGEIVEPRQQEAWENLSELFEELAEYRELDQ